MITAGEGKYKVFLEEKKIGDDIICVLSGGEKSHIGGIVVCEPRKDPQIIRLENHYDYVVLEPIAKTACEKYKTTVVAVGGIHIDNASKQEIEIIIENCKEILECI